MVLRLPSITDVLTSSGPINTSNMRRGRGYAAIPCSEVAPPTLESHDTSYRKPELLLLLLLLLLPLLLLHLLLLHLSLLLPEAALICSCAVSAQWCYFLFQCSQLAGALDVRQQQQQLPVVPQATTTTSPPPAAAAPVSGSSWISVSFFPEKSEELISMWANGHFTASLSSLALISHHALGFLSPTTQCECVCATSGSPASCVGGA